MTGGGQLAAPRHFFSSSSFGKRNHEVLYKMHFNELPPQFDVILDDSQSACSRTPPVVHVFVPFQTLKFSLAALNEQ